MTTPAPDLIVNVTLDKPVYAPGDVITVTADMLELSALTVTVSGTTQSGTTVNGTGSGSVQAAPSEPVTFGISDSLGDTWSQVSQSGGTAVFTATLPAAAAA